MIYKHRPSGDDNRESVAGRSSDRKEKKYRAETMDMNLGGLGAEINSYIGVGIVPMRIVPRVSNIHGKRKINFTLEGFNPETGKHILIFFDTRMRDNGSGYVKNFGGGLATELATKATAEEFYSILETVGAENDTAFDYDFSDWEDCGGALKLKQKFRGKPIVVGKRFIETEKGNNMNIFHLDVLDPKDFPDLEEDIRRYEALEGVLYDPDAEEAEEEAEWEEGSEEADLGGVSDSETVKSTPEPAKKSANFRQSARQEPAPSPRTKNRFASDADEVATEFNATVKATIGDMPKTVQIPDTVSDFIKLGYEKKMSSDQIILGMIEYGLKESEAVAYLEAWLDKREGRTRKPTASTQKAEKAAAKSTESDIVKTARECRENGMDSPETFDVLNKKFPTASRDEKRAALKSAGLIKI